MDKELLEQFQMLSQGIAQMEQRITEQIETKIQESESHIMVYIENGVEKKIEALFDGYKLTHEKQWELERKIEQLERRIERLEQVG